LEKQSKGVSFVDRDTNQSHVNIVNEIKAYVEKHYMEDITLNDLSIKYYMTSSYLSKIFKKVSGITFRKYLYTFRIQQAKRMLLNKGTNSMEKLCSMVGFKDVSYFYRVFQRTEGMTPTEYIDSMSVIKKVI
jgi:two-component system response regulator YesN